MARGRSTQTHSGDSEQTIPADLREAKDAADSRTLAGPSFGLCEGVREELERTGKAVDPFTGKTVTK